MRVRFRPLPLVLAAALGGTATAWADQIFQIRVYCERGPVAVVVLGTEVKNDSMGTVDLCAGLCPEGDRTVESVIAALPAEAQVGLREKLAAHEAAAAASHGTSVVECGQPCPVDDLSPLDATVQTYEDGLFDTDHMTSDMKTAYDCFNAAVAASGGTVVWSSGYRPTEYQAHLKDIWTKWRDIKNNTSAVCADRKKKIKAEFDKHDLVPTQEPANTSNHTRGEAFDATVTMPAGKPTKDEIAKACALKRPIPVKDPPHYQRTDYKTK